VEAREVKFSLARKKCGYRQKELPIKTRVQLGRVKKELCEYDQIVFSRRKKIPFAWKNK